MKSSLFHKKHRAFILGMFVLLLTMSISCGSGTDTSAQSSENGDPSIKLMTVSEQSREESIEVLGQIVYYEKVNVSSKVTGRLTRLLVSEGDRVSRGSLIAEIERLPLELNLREQMAELEIAQKNFELSKAKYENAVKSIEIRFKQIEKAKAEVLDKKVTWQNIKRILDNREVLYRAGGISKTDFESYRAQHTTAHTQYINAKADLAIQEVGFRDSDIRAEGLTVPKTADMKVRMLQRINTKIEKAELEAARSRITQVEKSIESTKIMIGETYIRSPLNGLVAAKSMEAGEMVKADSVIATLIHIARVYLSMNVSEKDAKNIHTGQKVLFTADAFEGVDFSGNVLRSTPVLDMKTRTLEVKALVENPGSKLLPGMFARAKIITRKAADCITVPLGALLTRDGEKGELFLVKKGLAFRQPVILGREYSEEIVVTKGLSPGNVIVAKGVHLVRPEMKLSLETKGIEENTGK